MDLIKRLAGDKKTKSDKKIMVIINPASNGFSPKKWVKIRELFSQNNAEISFSRIQGDATKVAAIAAKNKYHMVVACGGDGTMNEVLNGIVGTETALAVLPLGTGNVLAQELGTPLDIEKAYRRIILGQIIKCDVGVVKSVNSMERYFLCMAGVGGDAWVAETISTEMKIKYGIWAYMKLVFAGLKNLKNLQFDAELNLNGGMCHKQTNICLVMTGKATSHSSHNFQIGLQNSLTNGKLNILSINRIGLVAIARHLFHVLRGRRTYYQDLKYLGIHFEQRETLTVNTVPIVGVQADGEYIGLSPAHFSVRQHALKLVLP